MTRLRVTTRTSGAGREWLYATPIREQRTAWMHAKWAEVALWVLGIAILVLGGTSPNGW